MLRWYYSEAVRLGKMEHQLRKDPSTTRYAATIWRRRRHELPLCVAAFAHANFQVASSSAAHTPATDVHGSVGCRIPTFICARFSLPGATIISNAITNFLLAAAGALCVAIHFCSWSYSRVCMEPPCRPAAVLWYACCWVPRSYRPSLWG
jgi:hypothetical protein